jgi:PAS domain S-box-containing protein
VVIHRIVAALSKIATAEEVAETAVRETVTAFGAVAGALFVFEGEAFRILRAVGYPQALIERWTKRGTYEIVAMARAGKASFTHSRLSDSRWDAHELGDGAACMVPLNAGGRAFGIMTLSFDHVREFREEERETLMTLGAHCAQSLERALLFEAERRALAAAEAARRELEGVLEQLPVAAAVVRTDGRIFVNRQAAKIYGTDIRETDREHYPDPTTTLKHPDGRALVADEVPIVRALRGEVVSGKELVITPSKGEDRLVRVNAGPVRDDSGRIGAAVAVFADVTDEARMAKELRLLLDQLRDAVRVRDDFLSIAGHELRTPLAALSAQLVGLRVMQLDDEARAKKLAAAERQTRRLKSLVDQLLDVSRIVDGKLQLAREEIDLSALVREVVARLSEDFQRDGTPLDVSLSGPVLGRWDRLRVELVVTNLLTNALRYGQRRPVLLKVTGDEKLARVIVEDHGLGIRSEDQERIFERFVRAVESREFGGLGVGLWLARQIAVAHEGSLTVESEFNRGSRFLLALPR